ncbi:MAG: FG-GAP-like repeat-containing protein [Candidatus Altiarchaeia archaeon]
MKTHTFTAFFCLFILLAGISAAEDLSVKWSYRMNNTARAVVLAAHVADYDGDGFNDVAVGAKEDTLQGSAGWVYLLNNDGSVKWEHDTPGAISAMISADLSGEGKPQIIAGVSSRIYIFDGEGNSKQVSLGDLAYKATVMIADDINMDGSKELVVSGGSQDKGKVFIFDKDGKLPYTQATLGSPAAMTLSDLNGDGLKEIIVGTVGRDDEYPAYIQAYTPKGENLWPAYKTKKGILSIAVLDIDGDGSPEILAGSTDSLYVLGADGKEKEIKSNITRPGFQFNRILVTDMDDDGSEEVVFGCTNNVYMYDKSLKNLRWKNPVGTGVFDLVSEDIDGDGLKELLVASDILYIFNKDGTQVNSFNPLTSRFSVRDIYVADLNEDTYPDIIIGSTDGKVYVLGSSAQSKKIDANNLYRRGKEQYAERNYAEAQTSMRAAMRAYKDLGDNTKAQEINDILKRIMNDEAASANQTGEAQALLENAFSAFQSQDYIKAVESARIAKSKYYNINPKDPQITRLDNLINNSMETIGFQAENYLENASSYSGKNDYENALESAKNAAEAYAFMKDDAGLAKSQAIINASKQALGITDETTPEASSGPSVDASTLMQFFIGIAVIILIALLAGLTLKNRKTKKTMPQDQGSVLDKMDKEKIQKPQHRKEAIEKTHAHHHEKSEQGKHWIREADEAMKEARKQPEKPAEEHAEQAVPHPAHKHRHKLKRITKDTYRGAGISLRGVSRKETNESG